MKKIIAMFLVLSLFFVSCGEGESLNPDARAEISDIAEKANLETRLSGEYMFEITFGEGSVLYFSGGKMAWDRIEKKISSDFSQTYLGVSSKMKNYFANGRMVSIEDGNAIENERDAESFFTKFPYFSIPLPENDKITLGDNTSGKTYSFELESSKELSNALVGEDIYSLVNVIKKPQKELTEYGKASCIYTVADGKISSCKYEFDIKLFDTPAYIPGGMSQPEENYTIVIHISARLKYVEFGEDVVIEEYKK